MHLRRLSRNFEIRTREKFADRLQPIAAELCHMEGGELLKEIQDMYLIQMTEVDDDDGRWWLTTFQ